LPLNDSRGRRLRELLFFAAGSNRPVTCGRECRLIGERIFMPQRLVNMSAGQAVSWGWMENQAKAEMACAGRRAQEEMLALWVSEYSGTLYRVAFSVLRNATDAEDAVQEAFLRVLRHREKLNEIRDHRVWLIRIVWNVVLDRKRRAKTRPETDDVSELARVLPMSGLSAEERAAAAQHHAKVLACVEELPAKEREVLLLAGFEEMNSVEIAAALGISESSVRSRLFRARNLMAGLLGHKRSQR
jgi:RNA polymerase sigma-70 factor (ECF subfamily)